MLTPELIARVNAVLTKDEPLRSDALSQCWMSLSFKFETVSLPKDKAAISAAMCGILLALVREVWGEPMLCTRWSSGSYQVSGDGPQWVMDPVHSDESMTGRTEAEALVAALESAPCANG